MNDGFGDLEAELHKLMERKPRAAPATTRAAPAPLPSPQELGLELNTARDQSSELSGDDDAKAATAGTTLFVPPPPPGSPPSATTEDAGKKPVEIVTLTGADGQEMVRMKLADGSIRPLTEDEVNERERQVRATLNDKFARAARERQRLERVHQELEQMSAADRVEVSRLREKIEEAFDGGVASAFRQVSGAAY